MGTIVKKKIKERNYYYYVETKRVNGKSRFVNQKYLGTADKLLKIALDSKNRFRTRYCMLMKLILAQWHCSMMQP